MSKHTDRAGRPTLRARQARRDRGRRQVTVVTRVVAFGATVLAVLAGVVFAQQASGSTNGDTPSVQVPDVDSGGSGSAHGSSGGS